MTRTPATAERLRAWTFTGARTTLVRLERGADLAEALTRACETLGAGAGRIEVIGSVSHLSLSFFDQESREYRDVPIEDGAWEIASAIGNVTPLEGKPFVHLHLVASDAGGRCVAGHLGSGTIVYAAEIVLTAFDGGEAPERSFDEATGLRLWGARDDAVDAASRDSFPASDAPAY